MSCGCSKDGKDGKQIVDLVRERGKENMPVQVQHQIECSCGHTFKMETVVDKCPVCGMTYGVTPCGSSQKENILAAGIDY